MIKIVFWGTPNFAVPSLQRLLTEPDFQVVGVVTQPDKRRGRGSTVIASPIKKLATQHDLPVWQPERANRDQNLRAQLHSLEADAFVVVAYGQILSTKILKLPRLGAINSHASCLPLYRGAAPIQWAIYDGQSQTGVTTMMMDKGMDTGDMLLMSQVPIGLLTDAHQLADTLAAQSADLLVLTLRQLNEQHLQATPQDPSKATYARMIQKEDYAVDWSRSAIELHNQIRAFSPNCNAILRGQSLKLISTIPLVQEHRKALSSTFIPLFEEIQGLETRTHVPGQIVHLAKKWGPIVATKQGFLLLQAVQLAGRKRQSGHDFINGVRLTVGEQLQNGQTKQ